MRFFKYAVIGCVAFAASTASAQYNVTLTFVNGATRTVDELAVQDGKVILATENLQIPFAQIQSANFTFEEPLPPKQVETLMKGASYDEIIRQVDVFLEPVQIGMGLRGNLDLYIHYKMRALFWTEKYTEASRLAKLLQQKKSSYAPLAELYEVLIMLERGGEVEAVREAFDGMENPAEISGAMTEYIEGRLDFEVRENEKALKHFSTVLVEHRRDPEWVPAATYLEAAVYERKGLYGIVADVKNELKIAYAEGFWARKAVELD